MDESIQHLSNSEPQIASPARRPGKPKGHPKPPGSGRKPGVPNRVTKDIKALALKDAPAMLRGLKKLAETATDEKTKLAAIIAYLDRAVGKPMSPTELTGRDGEPLHPVREVSDVEAARSILFTMSKAAREKLPPGTPVPATYEGLKRVVNGEPWSPDEPEEVEARYYRPSPNAHTAEAKAAEAARKARLAEQAEAARLRYEPSPEERAAQEAEAQLLRHRQSIEDKCNARTVVSIRRKP